MYIAGGCCEYPFVSCRVAMVSARGVAEHPLRTSSREKQDSMDRVLCCHLSRVMYSLQTMSNGEYIGATQILRRISDFPEIQDLMDRMCERMLVAIEYRRNVGLMMGELAIFIRNVQDVFDDVDEDVMEMAWERFQEQCWDLAEQIFRAEEEITPYRY
ncbi:hypothetical protein QR680_019347 [Steinernema hermaphroditum]|uniref:Uncharacterized protein n=1 Tax=Steinernema hermaphroditum TaxID=289476 RepID=A0AA39LAT8_9BILA|nr:hypothetical protein QR680_019347 [Steinernema hermaphroditum]